MSTNIKTGLNDQEVLILRKKYGLNQISQKKENKLVIFLRQFWGPLPWLLELVAVLSFYSGNHIEGIIIIALLFVNSLISLFQRSKTDQALSWLQKSLQNNARVLRNGNWISTPVSELVPGDIIRLRVGDIVPADVLQLDGNLSVDQSSLTGESLPVELTKDQHVYSGSVIVRGEALAVVELTGLNTKYGMTAQLLETSHPPTHMEKIIFTIIKFQFGFNVLLIVLISAGIYFSHGKLADIIPLLIVLLITSVPIAFPTMFTIAQTFGASQLAKINGMKGILVRRLAAVQDCANMNVLCTDKTGTLTQNSLSISELKVYNKYSVQDLIELAGACSDDADQDPIDLAILKYLKEKNLRLIRPDKFIPFDPLTKKTASIIDQNKKMVFKGLPEIIVKNCQLSISKIEKDLGSLTAKGYRVIAVSEGKNEEHQSLVGLIAFEDPIRSDSKGLIRALKKHGIKIKMITGDNLETAQSIAKQLGFKVKACTTEQLRADPSLALTCNVFANAYPQDKLLIISELQRAGSTVGMTGDGVNDAPALHQAEVGIAVSNATDIAKNSASFILINPGLKDILLAVQVSREVYQRIRTWALNKIIKSFEIAMLSVIGYILTKNIILSPLLGVLFLFANDFVTISIATDNSLAEPKPANWRLSKMILSSVSLAGILLILIALCLLFARLDLKMNYAQIGTLAFLLLVIQGQASLYALRSWPHFWNIKPSRTLFLASLIVTIVIIILALSGVVLNKIPVISIYLILLTFVLSLFGTDLVKRFLAVSDH